MAETQQHGPASYTDALAARLRRLEPPGRLPGVDLARGLAVLGMFAAHLIVTTPLEWSSPSTWTGIVDGRSSVLFATLAGLSLGLTDGKDPPQRGAGLRLTRRRLVVRAVIIWLLGILLVALRVPVNVILQTYGLLFLIGTVFVALSTRALAAVAVGLVVVMPFVVGAVNAATGGGDGESTGRFATLIGWYYPFPLWAAFLAAGMVAGRLLVVSRRHAVGLVAVGAALAVLGYAVVGPVGTRASGASGGAAGDPGVWLLAQLQSGPHTSGMGEALGSGGFAIAAIGVCVLVGSTWLRWPLWPVRVLGSMPLTAYTAHIVIWFVWVVAFGPPGLGLDSIDEFRALEPFWPMTIWITAGCVLWAVLVGRGPLEAAIARISARLAEPGGVVVGR